MNEEPQTLYEAVERLRISVDNLKEVLKEELIDSLPMLFLIWWIFLHIGILSYILS